MLFLDRYFTKEEYQKDLVFITKIQKLTSLRFLYFVYVGSFNN